LDGTFKHRTIRVTWTFVEDGKWSDDGAKRWTFEVKLGDISVIRLFRTPLSQAEAEREAQRVAPAVFRVAEDWLK
jgi:hypothetical protein